MVRLPSQATLDNQRKTYVSINSKKSKSEVKDIHNAIDAGIPSKQIAIKHGINPNTFRKYIPYYKRISRGVGGTPVKPPVKPSRYNKWNRTIANRWKPINTRETFKRLPATTEAIVGYYERMNCSVKDAIAKYNDRHIDNLLKAVSGYYGVQRYMDYGKNRTSTIQTAFLVSVLIDGDEKFYVSGWGVGGYNLRNLLKKFIVKVGNYKGLAVWINWIRSVTCIDAGGSLIKSFNNERNKSNYVNYM